MIFHNDASRMSQIREIKRNRGNKQATEGVAYHESKIASLKGCDRVGQYDITDFWKQILQSLKCMCQGGLGHGCV